MVLKHPQTAKRVHYSKMFESLPWGWWIHQAEESWGPECLPRADPPLLLLPPLPPTNSY